MKSCCVYFKDCNDDILSFSTNRITDGAKNTDLDTVPAK